MGVEIVRPDALTGDQRVARAQGFLWEVPAPQASLGASIAMTSGVQYYTLFPLVPGETITGLLLRVATAGGASITLLKLGIVATDGTLLASTADVKAAFNATTGMIGGAFSSPYTPTAAGAAWACAVSTGTTLPTIARGNNSFAAAATGSGVVGAGIRSGLSDIAAQAPASGAAPHIYFAGY